MATDYDIWRSPSGNPDNADNEFLGVVTANTANQAVEIAKRKVACAPHEILWADATDFAVRMPPRLIGVRMD